MRDNVTLKNVREDSSYLITGIFKDEAHVPIPVADMFTARFWLFDHLGVMINSRADVDIMSSIDSGGNLTLTLEPADNPILDDTLSHEEHLLVIEWSWNAGTAKSHQNIYLQVKNDSKVPT